MVRPTRAEATVPQIATFTGHSLKDVEAILDVHHVGRDIQLAEAAALKLERRTNLAMLVQGVLRQDPFSGHLFMFRGRKADLIKIMFWDGTGLCLFTKRLEHGVFLWPSNVEPDGTLNSAQLSMLIDGVDWRAPERRWRPRVRVSFRLPLSSEPVIPDGF